MDKISLINGMITFASINQNACQDCIEIKIENGQTVIITASAGGHLKIGLNIDEKKE